MALDWNGKNPYLITYATKNNEWGHSIFGVDEYDENYQRTGNVILYDFWPAEKVSGLNRGLIDVMPIYRDEVIKKEDITKVNKLNLREITNEESKKPDGVLEFETSLNTDLILKKYTENLKLLNKYYNGASWNCSTFVLNILQNIESNFNALEPINQLWNQGTSVTPNNLYNKAKIYFNGNELLTPDKSLKNKFVPIKF